MDAIVDVDQRAQCEVHALRVARRLVLEAGPLADKGMPAVLEVLTAARHIPLTAAWV
jgi:hypothetical protein